MKKLLIATKNPGKFKQFTEFLDGVNLELAYLGQMDISDEDFKEDGETFEENALKKAEYYGALLGADMVLAEDSGLLVDALPGELGVKTRRWGAGADASDVEWIEYFMDRMKGSEQRGAQFVANVCILVDGKPYHFQKENRGVISEKLLAPIEEGIPLSSCFIPDGHEKVYAHFSPEEKMEVSHRGKAMAEAKKFLLEFLSDEEAGT